MQLFDTFEIMDAYPVLYWPAQDMIIVSDLHLGLEGLLAQSGVMMPQFQLDEMKTDLQHILEKTCPTSILINGDVKHEFSRTSFSERNEILDLFQFLLEYVEHIYIVKGNHDNYIYYVVKEYEEILLEDYFLFSNVLFMHGHLELDLNIQTMDFSYLIIGNEHPALSLQDEVGVKVKIPCFLYGPMDQEGKRSIIVLPSFSKLSQGAEMNDVLEQSFLSPVLRSIDVSKLKAIGISDELLAFPEIGKLH